MGVSKYSRERLEPIVIESRSLTEVLRRLGLQPTGGNHRYISSRIRRAGIETTHFQRAASLRRIESLPVEALQPLASASPSVAEVLRKLGLPTEGRPQRVLTQRLRELGIDTSHFTGSAWATGLTKQSSPVMAKISAKRTRPDAEVFVDRSPETNGRRIVRRLRALGWEYACLECGLAEWRGRPLVLHLDHINGVSDDNRLENLRLLCPNCHSQTETYCGRNRNRATAR